MLKINYDELAVEGLKDVLITISTTCKELEIDFFIVGAIARNIWLASHGENPTGTKDIDFGVYVPDVDKYNLLKEALIKNHNYVKSRENDYCLFTPDGKQVDLLPFGKIEQDGQVIIKGKGYTLIKPDGFEETYNLGLQKVKIGEEVYNACSIPAIVILKMIAYDDRPERRIKDIKDINDILHHYPNIEINFIWNNHMDLFDDQREVAEVAMIVIGREMRKVIGDNAYLKSRMLTIIDKAINQDSDFLKHMIVDVEQETLEMKAKMLNLLKKGIIGEFEKSI